MPSAPASVGGAAIPDDAEVKHPIHPVARLLDRLQTCYAPVRDGEIATYIPELAKADPEWFGIAVVAMDGHGYSVGDCDIQFTIQSISKPFVYGLALEDLGWEPVLGRVGLEPTGDAFNAISLDPTTGRPANPMINAGAIATTALVADADEGAMDRILRMLSRYAGRELEVDLDTYRSERDTGHRNRAISHLLRNFDHMPVDPEVALDVYFRQCSVLVTCRDLAMMAATLANGGVNPLTGARALDARYVDSVLSVMETCGMYNYAGEWKYRVGMPAKSGVAGGIIAPLVGQIGIGVFSPPLDARGNSFRGVRVCDDLSRQYGLHMLNVPDVSRSAVRAVYDSTQVRSKRHRSTTASDALDRHGGLVRIFELQGQLNFASVESLSREVTEAASHARLLGFDLKRVLRADPGATSLFLDMLDVLLQSGRRVAVSDAEHVPGLAPRIAEAASDCAELELSENRDRVIEWCEDQLLASLGIAGDPVHVPVEENELFAGLEPHAISELIERSERRTAKKGSVIVSEGATARALILFLRGHASAILDLSDGEHLRLDTNPPGTTYGEMLLAGDRAYPSTLVADSDVEYYELPLAAVFELSESDPRVMATLMRNVAGDLAAALRSTTAEIYALHSCAPIRKGSR